MCTCKVLKKKKSKVKYSLLSLWCQWKLSYILYDGSFVLTFTNWPLLILRNLLKSWNMTLSLMAFGGVKQAVIPSLCHDYDHSVSTGFNRSETFINRRWRLWIYKLASVSSFIQIKPWCLLSVEGMWLAKYSPCHVSMELNATPFIASVGQDDPSHAVRGCEICSSGTEGWSDTCFLKYVTLLHCCVAVYTVSDERKTVKNKWIKKS